MKSLFAKLKTKRSNQTVDLAWLQALDKLDDVQALEKSTQYLQGFATNASIADSQRLETLFIIDDHNRPRLQRVFHQYIKYSNLRLDIETRMAEAMYYFQHQLKSNYKLQIESLLQNGDKMRMYGHFFPLALARAMQAAFAMINLRHLAQMTTPSSTWLDIYRLYQMAEQEGVLNITLKLYDEQDSTSIDAIFVHGCMLDSLHHCNMNRQQLQLTADLIRTLAPGASTSSIYNDKKHVYFVHLGEDKGVRRVRNPASTSSHRYWEVAGILIKIDLILHSIQEKKSLESFGLGALETSPLLPGIMTMLKTEWTQYQRQRRKEERKRISKLATVSWGMESVTSQVKSASRKLSASTLTFEERLASHTVGGYTPTVLNLYASGERWTISDESNTGYGAEVDKEHALSVRQDKLANVILPDANTGNIIGIVRNVVDLSHNKRHVGIEVISRHASLVSAIKVDVPKTDLRDAVTITESLGMACLYLPAEEGLSEQASIIMPRLNYVENSLYELSNRSRKVVVRLGKAQDMKDDWARIMLTKVESAAA